MKQDDLVVYVGASDELVGTLGVVSSVHLTPNNDGTHTPTVRVRPKRRYARVGIYLQRSWAVLERSPDEGR